MSPIRLLPAEVADAIAAGEVVERPAAVVKELIENSVDAGARRVTVDVQGAGRNLIRVADDGPGISGDELELAFTRHATSKVASLEDLDSIVTLGFRGEALASIAAVSEVSCRSGASSLRIRHGIVLDRDRAPAVEGTVVEVHDLFGNTPARYRFLKTAATESAAIIRVVDAFALLYPEVGFRLSLEGRQVLVTPGTGDLLTAAIAVHGQAARGRLLAVELREPGISVSGLISDPHLSRGSRDGILIGVNRRPVVSRSLAYALEDCYRNSLEKGRYPIAVLNLELAPGEVDVNVHPTKREVRFRNEGQVFAALQRAVYARLSEDPSCFRLPAGAAAVVPGESDSNRAGLRASAPVYTADLSGVPTHLLRLPRDRYFSGVPGPRPPARPTSEGPLRPVGQVLGTYLVAEAEAGLVLVDQHAAHERVLYHRLLSRLQACDLAVQPALLPPVIDLDPSQAARAGELAADLAALGFEIEAFGPRSVRLLSTPAEMAPERAEAALLELIAEDSGMVGDPATRRLRWLERAATVIACHCAVRAGDQLDPEQQRVILGELEVTPMAQTCPHGRPTRIVIEWADVKRFFGRNY